MNQKKNYIQLLYFIKIMGTCESKTCPAPKKCPEQKECPGNQCPEQVDMNTKAGYYSGHHQMHRDHILGYMKTDDVSKCHQTAQWVTDSKAYMYVPEQQNCFFYKNIDGNFVNDTSKNHTIGCSNNKDPAKNCE